MAELQVSTCLCISRRRKREMSQVPHARGQPARLTSCPPRDTPSQAGRDAQTQQGRGKDVGEESTEHPDRTILLAERLGLYRPAVRLLLFFTTCDTRSFGRGTIELDADERRVMGLGASCQSRRRPVNGAAGLARAEVEELCQGL